MRTTLDLDEDVLQAAKELAEFHGKTAGQMVSELVRRGLAPKEPREKVRNGVPLLPRQPPGTPIMTMKRVNELRDDES